MEALSVSTLVVAVAEIGDKTQLLSLVLAARFGRPLAIGAGILVATLLNHAAAAWVGQFVGSWLTPDVMRWVIGISFIALALWACIPDKLDDDDAPAKSGVGAFVATVVAFFLAEMGDKTQVATVVLAAKYTPLYMVVIGTTLGMMLANVPAVWLGGWLGSRMHWLRPVRFVAAAIFFGLGLIALLGWAG
ncbi:TMEM165/GDT1 family protein [Chitinibacteraceae bacterium HSL-7]